MLVLLPNQRYYFVLPIYKIRTYIHSFNGPLSGTSRVSRDQKGKINLDFTEAKIVSSSGISWAICKSATRSRLITTSAPHHSVFYRPIRYSWPKIYTCHMLPTTHLSPATAGLCCCPGTDRSTDRRTVLIPPLTAYAVRGRGNN